jgi:G:T-mismatch repair DNA endonuclease (very short patch repair protein)
MKNITYKEIYEKTMNKAKKIKEAGYNLITIWENDWKKQTKSF